MFERFKTGLKSLKTGLARTHNAIMGQVESIFTTESREAVIEALTISLISADVGARTSAEIVDGLRGVIAGRDAEKLRASLRESIYGILKDVEAPLDINRGKTPFVIMVLGVNGAGKTTTIGKLAARYSSVGKSVLLAAGDTFRSAAIEQLEMWGRRANCAVVRHEQHGDPGAVAFDAIRAAMGRQSDVMILDTAGRLHTKVNLMEELKKVKRVVERELPGAPHENLLVLDASTGQNALNQARLFNEAIGVTGIALTKLDGTAKGGIIISIARELRIPIRFVGIGEGVEDLKDFDARAFSDALI